MQLPLHPEYQNTQHDETKHQSDDCGRCRGSVRNALMRVLAHDVVGLYSDDIESSRGEKVDQN